MTMKCACLTLTLCAFAHGQTPAQAPPKSSLSGQIVNAKTGAPLKKATVRLTMLMNRDGRGPVAAPLPAPAAPGQQQMMDQIMAQLATVQTSLGQNYRGPTVKTADTDEQGRFTFANLDSGKYRLTAERQGFLRQNNGERKFSGTGTPIVVGDGQNVKDIQVRMNPQAVITGRVLDEDGEPVPWVSLQLFQYGYSRGKRQRQASDFADTNDLGEYRLFDLAPGRYFLSANPQVEMDQSASGRSYAATYYPGTADAAGATLLDVRPGMQLRGIDIPLVKTRTARLRGRVIFPAKGPPNQPANVELVPRDESRGFSSSASPYIDAQGAFEFRGVAPGAYFLMAHWSQGEKLFSALHAIDIRENDVENIVLELSPASELKGQLRVEGPVPEKLADFQVTLDPDGSGNMGWPSTQVHNDGSFTLGNVVAGQFQLHQHTVDLIGLRSKVFNEEDGS